MQPAQRKLCLATETPSSDSGGENGILGGEKGLTGEKGLSGDDGGRK